MVKKSSFLLLVLTVLVGAFSGVCFANENSDLDYNNTYPALGSKFHSWITGYGGDTIAHTQEVSIATGKVLRQLDKKCNYEVVPYVDDTKGGQ